MTTERGRSIDTLRCIIYRYVYIYNLFSPKSSVRANTMCGFNGACLTSAAESAKQLARRMIISVLNFLAIRCDGGGEAVDALK